MAQSGTGLGTGLDYAAVAERLGLTEGTVRNAWTGIKMVIAAFDAGHRERCRCHSNPDDDEEEQDENEDDNDDKDDIAPRAEDEGDEEGYDSGNEWEEKGEEHRGEEVKEDEEHPGRPLKIVLKRQQALRRCHHFFLDFGLDKVEEHALALHHPVDSSFWLGLSSCSTLPLRFSMSRQNRGRPSLGEALHKTFYPRAKTYERMVV
ncbi:uncharacterized protein B0T15DRAFT_513109 [Chaetomium strumarium]|uniref:Uncharacterized protein n=1 Tax=Chaetomium strumarium TaxID=1170767 RepID=A0AAJ0GMU6_9PEZI|nr:hypothetical protein B0T15DRAFT_513109 [Chaetomium strumarium]